jgi:hypothetical protein
MALAMPSHDGELQTEGLKANIYLLLLNQLHFMSLTTNLSIRGVTVEDIACTSECLGYRLVDNGTRIYALALLVIL